MTTDRRQAAEHDLYVEAYACDLGTRRLLDHLLSPDSQAGNLIRAEAFRALGDEINGNAITSDWLYSVADRFDIG